MQATTKKPAEENAAPIQNLQIIRYEDGPAYFGYQMTALAEKIKAGEIPEPKFLAPFPSRSRGWTGEQIIKWHRDLDAAQAERAAAAKRYQERKPKPGHRKADGVRVTGQQRAGVR